MRYTILLLLILALSSCSGQTNNSVETTITDIRKPITPTRDILEKWVTIQADQLTKIRKNDSIAYDKYLWNNKPFTGWSREIFEDNDHKYRYAKYENGIMVWQIGYYANGQLDADFHMKDGKNVGSERMWHSDGSLYIDTYYNSAGEPDGLQWSWFKNGKVSRKGLYKNGEMIYEIYYDMDGQIKESKGEIPE
jgi:antitoxin component YwqK of YwqJK toxin-antitoxin module